MRFLCTVHDGGNGRWVARYEGADVGPLEVTADTRQDVVEKMRGELRYRLELCPCSGESYQHLTIDWIERQ